MSDNSDEPSYNWRAFERGLALALSPAVGSEQDSNDARLGG